MNVQKVQLNSLLMLVGRVAIGLVIFFGGTQLAMLAFRITSWNLLAWLLAFGGTQILLKDPAARWHAFAMLLWVAGFMTVIGIFLVVVVPGDHAASVDVAVIVVNAVYLLGARAAYVRSQKMIRFAGPTAANDVFENDNDGNGS